MAAASNTYKRFFIAWLLTSVLLLCTNLSFAQPALPQQQSHLNLVSTNVCAVIVTALTLTETSPLHFGTMTVPSTEAIVKLTALGFRSIEFGSGAMSLLSQTPYPAVAAYNVSGTGLATYAINFPPSDIIIKNAELDEMIVNSFTSSKNLDIGTLSSAGFDNFTVGASLHLVPNQAPGIYQGEFAVTVNYN